MGKFTPSINTGWKNTPASYVSPTYLDSRMRTELFLPRGYSVVCSRVVVLIVRCIVVLISEVMASLLIDEVRKRPALWNFMIDLYRDKGVKELAWQEIVDILHKPIAELKLEWKKLRDSHRNALKRKETKSGQAAFNSKHWKYEKNMEFLLSNVLPHTQLENNIPPVMEDTTEDEGNDTTLQENSTLDVTVEESPSPQVQQSTVRQRPPKGVDKLIHYLNAKKKIKNIRQAPDDIDMFFGSASISVKKLPRRLQNRIKRDVLDLISQAEEENELLMESLISSATPPVYPSPSGSSSYIGFIDSQTESNSFRTSLSQTGTLMRTFTDNTYPDS